MPAVNLRAPFLLAQRAAGSMREPGSGRILLISRAAAFTGGIAGPHHAASKAGLHTLTHFLASRLAATGVTVNALAPALVAETRMLPGDPAQLRGRCRPAGSASHPRSPTSPRPSSPRPT
jgi:3-oxoacyl-[acyl-carrier protein] reductase